MKPPLFPLALSLTALALYIFLPDWWSGHGRSVPCMALLFAGGLLIGDHYARDRDEPPRRRGAGVIGEILKGRRG